MEKVKVNRENITRHLIEYQLAMVGKSMIDTLDEEYWYNAFTMTKQQHAIFRVYSVKLIQKIFKCNRAKAQHTFEWFNQAFGLKIKD